MTQCYCLPLGRSGFDYHTWSFTHSPKLLEGQKSHHITPTDRECHRSWSRLDHQGFEKPSLAEQMLIAVGKILPIGPIQPSLGLVMSPLCAPYFPHLSNGANDTFFLHKAFWELLMESAIYELSIINIIVIYPAILATAVAAPVQSPSVDTVRSSAMQLALVQVTPVYLWQCRKLCLSQEWMKNTQQGPVRESGVQGAWHVGQRRAGRV